MIFCSKDIVLYICKYISLNDILKKKMRLVSKKKINRIISNYIYKTKNFNIFDKMTFDLIDSNVQYITISDIFPNMRQKFYNLIDLRLDTRF
jgi:signal recognition particle GTPase